MKLSENYSITYDNYNVILRFSEHRDIKAPKTGETRTGEIIEDTYHPTVKAALKAFLHKSIRGSESIEECLKRIKDVEDKIDTIIEENILTNT